MLLTDLLCNNVSRSGFASACEYCISSCSDVSNLWTPNPNTVPNSFGISSKTFARAHSRVRLKELSRVKFRRLSRLNTFQIIARSLPKFMIIPVELMYFVMLSNAFRKRTCKNESKQKSYKSSDEIALIILRIN